MPGLMELLHYRTIDVSTLKELSRRWYPYVYSNRPVKHGGHRALADIIESIDELRYYREMMFVPDPGPTFDQAAQGCAHVEGQASCGNMSRRAIRLQTSRQLKRKIIKIIRAVGTRGFTRPAYGKTEQRAANWNSQKR